MWLHGSGLDSPGFRFSAVGFKALCFGAAGFQVLCLGFSTWVSNRAHKGREEFVVLSGLAYCSARGVMGLNQNIGASLIRMRFWII